MQYIPPAWTDPANYIRPDRRLLARGVPHHDLGQFDCFCPPRVGFTNLDAALHLARHREQGQILYGEFKMPGESFPVGQQLLLRAQSMFQGKSFMVEADPFFEEIVKMVVWDRGEPHKVENPSRESVGALIGRLREVAGR